MSNTTTKSLSAHDTLFILHLMLQHINATDEIPSHAYVFFQTFNDTTPEQYAKCLNFLSLKEYIHPEDGTEPEDNLWNVSPTGSKVIDMLYGHLSAFRDSTPIIPLPTVQSEFWEVLMFAHCMEDFDKIVEYITAPVAGIPHAELANALLQIVQL